MNGYPIQMEFVISVILLCAQQRLVSSFAPVALPLPLISRREHGRSVSIMCATTLASVSTSNPKQTIQTTSNELLTILQQKAASNSKTTVLDDQINSLVRTLIASKARFDPIKCIDGPLFASIHFIGDTPLWERIGSGVRNVKGQKYTLDGVTSSTFVNYAEIWGENFYLKAVGNCNDKGPVLSASTSNSAPNNEKSSNPLAALASLFNSGKNGEQSALLPTPYDYSATVKGASIVLFQKFSLDLSIEGTGTVRVLYADENLRIFLSPTDTNVTKGGGDWEREGLIVVQVRIDLVYDDWVDML